METLYDLFEHELKDLYDAEQKLVKALSMQANEVVDDEVGAAFEEHMEETRGQVERLEEVFERLGIEAERHTCHGMDGLLREKEAFVKEDPSIELLQLFNLGAAAKVERYEITAYESLIRMAEQLGVDDEVIELLQENLEEEEATLDIVTRFLDESEPVEAGEVVIEQDVTTRR